MGTILSVFLAALILAYVLEPVVEKLHQRRLPLALSALIAITLGLAATVGLLVLVVSIVGREAPRIKEQFPVWMENTQKWIAPQFEKLNIHLDWAGIKAQIIDRVTQHFSSNAETLISRTIDSVLSSGQTFIAVIATIVLVVFVVFYLLMDWARFFERLSLLIPPRQREVARSLAAECDGLLSQYLRGQLLVMLVLAIYYATALHLLGMAGGVAIGIFTGVAIFIPYIGFGIGLLLASISAVLQFGPDLHVLGVLVIYGIGQVVESFFLTPKLVGERIGLHPVAVVFALLFFGSLFGFFGVLLALPAAAITLVAARFLMHRYAQSDWYQGK